MQITISLCRACIVASQQPTIQSEDCIIYYYNLDLGCLRFLQNIFYRGVLEKEVNKLGPVKPTNVTA